MAKKTQQIVPEIIDSVEGLNAKMAAMREAQKVFATYTQEQVDKITSTSPVSTEDMKSAVEKAKQDLQTQLNDLSALVENPDGEKTLKEKIAALEQALADATGDKAKDLAARLADLQNQRCIYSCLPR